MVIIIVQYLLYPNHKSWVEQEWYTGRIRDCMGVHLAAGALENIPKAHMTGLHQEAVLYCDSC